MSVTTPTPNTVETPDPEAPAVPREVYQAIGNLTRQLHDALNELGYADQLRGTVSSLPDAKSRLSYISRLTGEAAEKVLNRVDAAKKVHEEMVKETTRVAELVRQDPVKAVASGALLNFVESVNQGNCAIDQHLTEIMMAQDFHDLTGQVISRVVNLATTIENQLVHLLIQTAPPIAVTTPAPATPVQPAAAATADATRAEGSPPIQLDGPVVDAAGRSDVVTDQSQVDDLLASLGF